MNRAQLETTPLAQIVRHDFRAGAILDGYHLDFCCGGALSLADACQQRGVEVERIVAETRITWFAVRHSRSARR